MYAVGKFSGTFDDGSASPAAIAFCSAKFADADIAIMLKIFATEPRLVSCAPFGKPVVPDV